MKRVALYFVSMFVVFGLIIFYLYRSEDITQKMTTAQELNATVIGQPEKNEAPPVRPLATEQNGDLQPIDYHDVALKLLQKAREGDGKSQFELVRLLEHCYHAVNILDIDAINTRDTAKQSLSHQLSDAERNMVNQFLTELDSCSNFRGGGFEQFNDGANSDYAVTDAFLYWLKKSLLNDGTSAAIILLGYDANGGEFLSEEERTKAKDILQKTISNPSADNLYWLSRSFSKSKYASVPAVNWQYIREPRSMTFAPITLNSSIFKCLNDKYVKLQFTEKPVDCAVNVQKYGKWYDPKFSAEIEAEAKRVHDAWQNGDYAGAGYGALLPYLSDSYD